MPKCTVCHHPQHLEINQAILSGDFTLAGLSRKFGPSISALHRHQNHIEIKMSQARRRLREIREQGSLFLLNDLLEQVRAASLPPKAKATTSPSFGAPTSPAVSSISPIAWRGT